MSHARSGGTVPDAVTPPPGNPRFPLFDSLRAVAVLGVLLVHAAEYSGSFHKPMLGRLLAHLDIGLALFFVISGFLLYRPFVAARILGAPAITLRTYARRRFLRIAPGYWLALTALGIFPGIYGVFTGNWWVYYGLLVNYPVYTPTGGCTVDGLRCGIVPAWTLGIEVGFYVVLPFFAMAVAGITKGLRGAHWLRAELAVLGLIAAISVPLVLKGAFVRGFGITAEQWAWFSPLGHGWWFGAGMALAAVSVRMEQRKSESPMLRVLRERPILPWALAASLYLVLCLVLDPISGERVSQEQYAVEYVAFGTIAALLLVPAVFEHRAGGFPRRVLANPVLAWLGLVSYGVFLWHWPILYALREGGIGSWWPALTFPVLLVTTLAISLICASLSYYAVERPLLRFKASRRGLAAGLPVGGSTDAAA